MRCAFIAFSTGLVFFKCLEAISILLGVSVTDRVRVNNCWTSRFPIGATVCCGSVLSRKCLRWSRSASHTYLRWVSYLSRKCFLSINWEGIFTIVNKVAFVM